MEHRWYKRVNIPLDVTIHVDSVDNTGSLKYLAYNISQGGLLVKRIGLAKIWNGHDIRNKVVNVEFNENPFSVTLPALVLRYSENTAALMFTTFHPALRTFLHDLKLRKDNTANAHDKKTDKYDQSMPRNNLRIISRR